MVLLFSSLRFMVNKAPDELLLFTDLIIFVSKISYNTNQIPYTLDSKNLADLYTLLRSVYEMTMMSSLT